MSELQISQTIAGGVLTVSFRGAIDEGSDLGKIDLQNHKTVIFDLGEVDYINSIGIRSWLVFFKQAGRDRVFVFRRCSEMIVMQMGLVNGFLPLGSKIESVYVPYVCDDCGTTEKTLFVFGGAQTLPETERPCPKCEKTMTLEVPPQKYFRALQNR